MTNEQKLALIEALKFYIPVASPHKPDTHIKLLEDLLVELEGQIDTPPDTEELFK